MVVTSRPLCFSMLSSSRCSDLSTPTSMLASLLPPSFLLPSFLPPSFLYSHTTSSLGCNALCMAINFLVLWSICLSSYLVHFKNGAEYLTRATAQVFISLVRFLLHGFVSGGFPVFLRYSFLLFFPFIFVCLIMPASKMHKYL